MRPIAREWCAIRRGCRVVLMATLAVMPKPQPAISSSDLAALFAPGGLLQDRNGDGVIDFVHARVVLGERPNAADVSAAANLAARLGFETMAMNLPLSATPAAGATAFIVGRDGIRRTGVTPPAAMASLRPGEGMIVTATTPMTPAVIVSGADDAGTMAAAETAGGPPAPCIGSGRPLALRRGDRESGRFWRRWKRCRKRHHSCRNRARGRRRNSGDRCCGDRPDCRRRRERRKNTPSTDCVSIDPTSGYALLSGRGR